MHQSGGPLLLDALTTAWLRKITGKSGQAVADWRQGKIPPARLAEITDAVRALLPDTTKEPPRWAEALVEDVPAIRSDVERVVNELETLRVVLEAIESGLLRSGGDPVGDPAPLASGRRRDQ